MVRAFYLEKLVLTLNKVVRRMRKRKLTFQEMIQQNKEELLKDERVLEELDKKFDSKHGNNSEKEVKA